MNSSIEILKELKSILIKAFGNDIDKIILFGSRAKGTANKDSDYDILIILKNDYDWNFEHKIYKEVLKIELDKEVFFDTHIISENELKYTIRGAEPVINRAIEEGIYV